jgi:hypothetical protein
VHFFVPKKLHEGPELPQLVGQTGRFTKNRCRRVTQSMRLAIEWQGTESAKAISKAGYVSDLL